MPSSADHQRRKQTGAGSESERLAAKRFSIESGIFEVMELVVETRGYRSHGLAQPHVGRIAVEPWMPRHQEMKRMQFAGCFYQAQLAMAANDRAHAAGYGEHEFRARKALQGHAEVRHSNA